MAREAGGTLTRKAKLWRERRGNADAEGKVMAREAGGKTFGIAPATLRSTVPPAVVLLHPCPLRHPGSSARTQVSSAHPRPRRPSCPSCPSRPGRPHCAPLSHRQLCFCTRTFSPRSTGSSVFPRSHFTVPPAAVFFPPVTLHCPTGSSVFPPVTVYSFF